MAEKRILEKVSDFDSLKNMKSEKIKEAFCDYAWNSPRGFIRMVRLARLAEINAPLLILLNEMKMMCDQMAKDNIARNEIARIKTLLFTEYPGLDKKIKKARQENRKPEPAV